MQKKMDYQFYFSKGEVIIDDGAIGARKQGKSLLAAGIKKLTENLIKVTI